MSLRSTDNENQYTAPLGTLYTTMGVVHIEMYWKQAPITCCNFSELVRRGYYNNTIFHRVAKDFLIQGGDPTGTGNEGYSIYGKYFEDEFNENLKFTGAGIVAMANDGINRNASQFFITLAPMPWLDRRHTIFGRVISGMEALNLINEVECDVSQRPISPVKIVTANLSRYLKLDDNQIIDSPI